MVQRSIPILNVHKHRKLLKMHYLRVRSGLIKITLVRTYKPSWETPGHFAKSWVECKSVQFFCRKVMSNKYIDMQINICTNIHLIESNCSCRLLAMWSGVGLVSPLLKDERRSVSVKTVVLARSALAYWFSVPWQIDCWSNKIR